MAVVRNLMVRAGADFSDLYKEMKTANSRMGAFGKGMSTAFKGAAIGAAAVAVGTYMKDAVYKASDLNEAMSATGQVFGDAFGQIEQFAKGSATQLGQTSTEIYNAARNFGVFGNAAGLASKENAAFSKDLVGLATDLASFYNTSVEQATTALSAGLRGESEPLRQYGVLLDEATLRQRALAMGIVSTTTQALTPQQRVLAANAEIFAQSSIAQGDWARTNMGLAGQTKIFNAQLAELKVSLGQAFLPIVTTVMPILNSFVGGLVKAANWTSEFMNALFGEKKQKSTSKQTKAVTKQSNAYKALGDNIKSAGKSANTTLASFDQINSLAKGGTAAIGLTPTVSIDDTEVIQEGSTKVKKIVEEIEKKSSAEKLAAKIKVVADLYQDEERQEKQNKFLVDYKKEFQKTSNTYPMNLSVTPQAEIKHTKGALTLDKIKEFFKGTSDEFKKVTMENGLSNISTTITPQLQLKKEPKTQFWGKVWNWLTDNGKDMNQAIKEYREKNPKPLTNQINVDTTFKTDKNSFFAKLGNLFKTIGDWWKEFWKGKGLSTTFNAASNITGVGAGGKTTTLPINMTVPAKATGGIATSTSVAMLGEAGREAILPLDNNTGWMNELAAKLSANMNGGQGDIVINIGSTQLARITANEMNRLNRQAGRTVLNV